MNFEYRLAKKEDLDALVGTRIHVLKAANELPDSTDMSVMARESRRYYKQSFAKNTHVEYLVYSANKIVGAGGVSFYQVLPTFHNPSGEKADIMNMYTDPEYRRRGIGWKTLDLLVEAAKARGVALVTLEATKMGRPLYEEYEFVQMEDEMLLLKSKL